VGAVEDVGLATADGGGEVGIDEEAVDLHALVEPGEAHGSIVVVAAVEGEGFSAGCELGAVVAEAEPEVIVLGTEAVAGIEAAYG